MTSWKIDAATIFEYFVSRRLYDVCSILRFAAHTRGNEMKWSDLRQMLVGVLWCSGWLMSAGCMGRRVWRNGYMGRVCIYMPGGIQIFLLQVTRYPLLVNMLTHQFNQCCYTSSHFRGWLSGIFRLLRHRLEKARTNSHTLRLHVPRTPSALSVVMSQLSERWRVSGHNPHRPNRRQ